MTVLFRHAFSLPEKPVAGELYLFADTRYRLEVNGVLVVHGPARFKKPHPLYDRIDLGSYLVPGENVIAVTVTAFPYGTFISDPGPGCLIAWGTAEDGGGTHHFATGDTGWKALVSPAHDPEMPNLSFAVGPGECLDARSLPEGWTRAGFDDAAWPEPAACPKVPWETLEPRDIPMLDESDEAAPRCLAAFSLTDRGDTVTYAGDLYDAEGRAGVAGVRGFIHADSDAACRLRLSAGTLLVNRQEGGESGDAPDDEAEYREVPLQSGWNELLLYNRTGRNAWEFALELAPDEAATVREAPREDAAEGFQWAGPVDHGLDEFGLRREIDTDALVTDLDAAGWRRCLSIERGREVRPMVRRRWDRLERCDGGELPAVPGESELGEQFAGTAGHLFLFDFEREVLGRPRIELTAPEGLVIDLTYTERLDEEGRAIPWYQGTRMAERYICREGRQSWHLLQPRGMRYLELIVRGALDGATIHGVGMTRALFPGADVGAFACSDARLNEIWELGRHTQRVCMEDTYLDCPWRERGLYVADLLVQYHTNLALLGDHALMRRSLDLIFQSLGENDLLPPCPHGLKPGKLPDFSAIAVTCLRRYWEMTGDSDTVRRLRSPVMRLLNGLRSLRVSDPVLAGWDGVRPYVDNGMVEKSGISAGLNLIIQRALSDAAFLLQKIDHHPGEAETGAEEAAVMARALRKRFFEDATGLFVDNIESTAHSIPVNTLAVLSGVARDGEVERIAAWLAGQAMDNFPEGPPVHRRHYRVSPMFSFHLLGVLFDCGHAETAVAFMKKYWGYMLDEGAWTCWEFFAPVCSLCHAWSSSPTHHLPARVLGIRPAADGSPDYRLIFDPQPAGLKWAEGSWPHPTGPVRVRWERDDDSVRYSIDAPEGVEIRDAAGQRLFNGTGILRIAQESAAMRE